MSFASKESSRAEGNPITLYYFRYGSAIGSYYAFTDAEQIVTVAGVDYEPVPIQRGNVAASGSLDKANLEVRLARDNPVADLFRVYPPSQVVTLVIKQGHYDDGAGEFLAVWTGRVLGCAWEDSEVILTGEPVSTSLRRAGLRRHYQFSCPHALYGPKCNANQNDVTQDAVVAAIEGVNVTLAGGWNGALAVGKYIGGLFSWTNGDNEELRTILRVDGNTLMLSGSLSGLIIAGDCTVAPGCNRQMTDCETLFDNILNFGGQPWIPLKNPIGVASPFV